MHAKNIQNKDILKSIPMLASALSNKYGVEVEIGGETACTDSNTIYLPSLPIDCDEDFLGFLRGYLDHESAHIRYSDFDLLAKAHLSDFEKYIWNCIEDWRIEKKMSSHFNGCKYNFQWLIKKIFVKARKDNNKNIQQKVASWLLISIRSWDLEELEAQADALAKDINQTYPKLIHELGVVLSETKAKCETPKDSLKFTKKIIDCISNYIKFQEKENQKDDSSSQGNAQNGHDSEDSQNKNKEDTDNETNTLPDTGLESTKSTDSDDASLWTLLACDGNTLPRTTGEALQILIEKTSKANRRISIKVARTGYKSTSKISPRDKAECLKVSVALKSRLQGLLQAQSLVRRLPARHGKINKNRLHSLAVNSSKVFLQNTISMGTNTAIHILLDTSGSMAGKMQVAMQSCYALTSALSQIKGINVGVSTFPAKVIKKRDTHDRITGVYPLLKHGEKLHENFSMTANEGTPLAESLLWLLSTLIAQKESRKIVLLITDGEPDDRDSANIAIDYAKRLGVEVYGIGLPPCPLIEILLPNSSITISNINELPQAMFGLLQSVLVNK